MLSKQRVAEVLSVMANMFPDAHCELHHSNTLELTVAVVLSAQCTDQMVNKVTNDLFKKYRTAEDYVRVPLEELENDIRRIGLYRSKAKNIQKLCRQLLEDHNGEVPDSFKQLTDLAGVGRKTANVILATAFHQPAIAVDTHVERVSKRLGICRWKDSPLQVEQTLMRKIPESEWAAAHHRFIFFGRYHCKAQRPKCSECPLLHMCREGRKRMNIRRSDTTQADSIRSQ